METNEITDAELKEVSGYLRQQVELCHAMARDVRETFYRETNRTAQDDTLKMMIKLMGAAATAAGAMSRIKGTQIQQTIVVVRANKAEAKAGEGAPPDSAKTNGGGPG